MITENLKNDKEKWIRKNKTLLNKKQNEKPTAKTKDVARQKFKGVGGES